MSLRAGIDVGTNAVKGCVLRADSEPPEVLREWRVVTRLGEGWATQGRLLPAPMARTCKAVCEIVNAAKDLGADQVRVAGTSACRDAANTAELAAYLHDTCGVTLEILTGEQEARLSFVAVGRMHRITGLFTTVDIGGGSTEWAMGSADQVDWAVSLPVGAVRLTEQLLGGDPPSPSETSAADAWIEVTLSELPDLPETPLLITGGAAHTMAEIHAESTGHPREAGRILTLEEVERQIALYARVKASDRAKILGMEPARADIILAGALILKACMLAARVKSVTVSNAGVRHGLALLPAR